MIRKMPWLRLYTEIIDDEKLGLLAFEDRWHYVALLCLKGKGVLDEEADPELLMRKVAYKLGLTCSETEKVAARLAKMGLIDAYTFQPLAWDNRQYESDFDKTNAQRQKRYRERKKGVTTPVTDSNALITGTDTDTDTDTEEYKTPAPQAAPVVSHPLKPEDIEPGVWHDFTTLRKAKKAPLTATAIDGIRAQAGKAGLSLGEVLRMCCERGWTGFKADWVLTQPNARGAPATLPSGMLAGAI